MIWGHINHKAIIKHQRSMLGNALLLWTYIDQ